MAECQDTVLLSQTKQSCCLSKAVQITATTLLFTNIEIE